MKARILGLEAEVAQLAPLRAQEKVLLEQAAGVEAIKASIAALQRVAATVPGLHARLTRLRQRSLMAQKLKWAVGLMSQDLRQVRAGLPHR